jgi:hypothetical protein
MSMAIAALAGFQIDFKITISGNYFLQMILRRLRQYGAASSSMQNHAGAVDDAL